MKVQWFHERIRINYQTERDKKRTFFEKPSFSTTIEGIREVLVNMSNLKKRIGEGFYNLLADRDLRINNPIYKGPKRNDLVLDVTTDHNKVISRLLQSRDKNTASAADAPSPPTIHDPIDEMLKIKAVKKYKPPSTSMKVLQSLLLGGGFFVLGMCLVLMHIELPELRKAQLRSDVKNRPDDVHMLQRELRRDLSIYVDIRTLGALIGASILPKLMSCCNSWGILSVSMFSLGAGVLSIPFCMHINGLVKTFSLLCGFFLGIYASVGSVKVMRIWRKKHAPWLQMCYFLFVLATCLTPFILEQFNHNNKYELISDTKPQSTSEYLFVIGEKPSPSPTDDKFLFIIHEQEEAKFQKANQGQIKNIKEELEYTQSRSEWLAEEDHQEAKGPVISDMEQSLPFPFILTSVTIFCLAFSYLFTAFVTYIYPRTTQLSFDDGEVMKMDDDENDDDNSIYTCIKSNMMSHLFIFLLFFFYIGCCVSHITYVSAIDVFAKELSMPSQHIWYLMKIFWVCMLLGSFLAIPLTLCMRPGHLLGFSVFLMVLPALSLAAASFLPALLLAISGCIGLSASVLFTSGLSWTYKEFNLSKASVVVFLSGSLLAQVIVQYTIPVCLSSFGNQVFSYILLVSVLTVLFIFIALLLVGSKVRKPRNSFFEETQEYEEDF